jgi:MoxR-like ATPase
MAEPAAHLTIAPKPANGAQRAIETAQHVLDNVEAVVRGKRREISLVLTALACEGHVLIEDVPGTAKTVLARALEQSVEGASVERIQCTPDLQPTDVTGLAVYDPKGRKFDFPPGPIFANVILVDEINRAMPKTQSAVARAAHAYLGHGPTRAVAPERRTIHLGPYAVLAGVLPLLFLLRRR